MWRVVVAMVCASAFACGGDGGSSTPPSVDCINGYAVESAAVPAAGHSVVLASVALPTERALSVVRSGLPSGLALWTKDGLVVSTDRVVEVRVADEWRGKFSFAWGQSLDGPVERLRIPACSSSRGAGNWLAFTGGYYVAEPACVSLVVRVGRSEQRVPLGIGAPCPGQNPPG
jgi:hypothetical protein